MARKKVTPEEEIVNTAVEGTALGRMKLAPDKGKGTFFRSECE